MDEQDLENNQPSVFYISYWRYVLLACPFALMLFVICSEFWSIGQRFPVGFWKTWNGDSKLTLFLTAAIIFLVYYIIKLLKFGHHAIQLEIGGNYVKFRKRVIRGGIMLSDKYITLKFSEIKTLNIRKMKIIDYVIDIVTADETFSVVLIMSGEEKLSAYKILSDNADSWLSKRPKQSKSIYKLPKGF